MELHKIFCGPDWRGQEALFSNCLEPQADLQTKGTTKRQAQGTPQNTERDARKKGVVTLNRWQQQFV
jgi:hypothetical protein